MYKGVLDIKYMRDFFISIGYPIGPPSKLNEENQETIKIVMPDRITTQARPLDVLITALHELHLRKKIEMVNTRSNVQLADLNSKPHGGKSLRNIIDRAIGVRFNTPPGSLHYQQICLD